MTIIQHRDCGDEQDSFGYRHFDPPITEGHPEWVDCGPATCLNSSHGYLCTMEKGHVGDHFAHGNEGLIARWQNSTPTITNLQPTKKERVFEAWAVWVEVGGDSRPAIHFDERAAIAFAALLNGRIVPCRVIVEEP